MLASPDGEVAERVSYGELIRRAGTFAAGLRQLRSRGRAQTLLLATPPSVDHYALQLAALGSGVRLALIDGPLDRRAVGRAIRAARPRIVVASDEFLGVGRLLPSQWRARRYAPAGGALAAAADDPAPLTPGRPEDVAAVRFGGGHGRAVVRTNGLLLAEHEALRANVPVATGDVELTWFPATVLHNLASGITTVLAPGAQLTPAGALQVVRAHGVGSLSAPPAVVAALQRHAAEAASTSADPPRLRQIVLAGGPVSRALLHDLAGTFPDTWVMVVYGCAAAEPIAHVTAREILAEADEGSWREPVGLLVGRPVQGVRAEVVTLPERVRERVTEQWIEARRSPIGEIVVYGQNVSRRYEGDRDATARRKLQLKDGAVWHRTGDLGRFDADGRLRLLGRIGDEVDYRGTTVYPLPLEARLEAVRGVRRAGLVEVKGKPMLAVELEAGGSTAAVRRRLEDLGLGALKVRALASIPREARHHSKIDRPLLQRLLLDDSAVDTAPSAQ